MKILSCADARDWGWAERTGAQLPGCIDSDANNALTQTYAGFARGRWVDDSSLDYNSAAIQRLRDLLH